MHELAGHRLFPLVERLLLEQGRLNSFELLMAAGLLYYEDYQEWRRGQRPELISVLKATPGEAAELLAQAGDLAASQALTLRALTHETWGVQPRLIRIGEASELESLCAREWTTPEDDSQLDLFQDAGTQHVEGAIAQALGEHRPALAQQEFERLAAKSPEHPHLRGFSRLLQLLEHDRRSGEDPVSLKVRIEALENNEQPARALLGHHARDFLAARWMLLAERLAERSFDPSMPELHPARAWLRAQCFRRARASVEREACWREHPDLVAMHAWAAWRLFDQSGARRDWIWLCWTAPDIAAELFLARDFPDQLLGLQWQRFSALPDLQLIDFPAWLLLQDAGMLHQVPGACAPVGETGRIYRLVARLVAGESITRVHDLERLQALHPALARCYRAASMA